MTNSADPDQLASEEANWSGSTLFANTGNIQDQELIITNFMCVDISFFLKKEVIIHALAVDRNLWDFANF